MYGVSYGEGCVYYREPGLTTCPCRLAAEDAWSWPSSTTTPGTTPMVSTCATTSRISVGAASGGGHTGAKRALDVPRDVCAGRTRPPSVLVGHNSPLWCYQGVFRVLSGSCNLYGRDQRKIAAEASAQYFSQVLYLRRACTPTAACPRKWQHRPVSVDRRQGRMAAGGHNSCAQPVP
jgi:hypothetical protein